jgi:vancomycin resistance protein YoaR
VGNDVISYKLSDLGVFVGSTGVLAVDSVIFTSVCQRLNGLYGTSARNAQVLYTDDPASPIAFASEESGQRIDESSLRRALTATGTSSINLEWTPVAADVTIEDLQGRYSLLSEFSTSFKGSTLGRKNRVNNMALAVTRINGIVLGPGEEFSMNKTILDRTKENGYYLAPAIRNGTYEKEYGGGVCQVSSTLFNAVMMADLPVTERHHHSWPMHYVPIGRDATIATGYKDFKFVNSTEGELVIFAHLDKKAKKITVKLYGIHSPDFDHIQIVSKRTGSLPSKGTKVLLDESLSAGSRVEERKERRGKTSVTYKEYYDAAGKMIRRETAYEDSYPSIEGLVYVAANLYR